MNTTAVNKINQHYQECGSTKYFRITLFAGGKSKIAYCCKKCKTRILVDVDNNQILL